MSQDIDARFRLQVPITFKKNVEVPDPTPGAGFGNMTKSDVNYDIDMNFVSEFNILLHSLVDDCVDVDEFLVSFHTT